MSLRLVEPTLSHDRRSGIERVLARTVAPKPTVSKPKFAIDIDSTLYDFEIPAREAFRKLAEQTDNPDLIRGEYHSWDEWRSPADICGIKTWMEVITMCHSPEVVESQIPFAGAVATLQALAKEGYGLTYISTRTPEAAGATYNWLRKWDFPIGEGVEIKCQMEDKGPFLAECQFLIDDRPKTLLDFVYDPTWDKAQGERRGLALMYKYNRALTDVPSIFLAPTWSGLSSWLVRKRLLPEPTHPPLEAA